MAAEVIAGRIPLSTRSKSDTSVHDADRRDSVKSDTSSTVGHRRAGRPQDRTTRRRSVAVMDLGNQPRKPVQAFKTSLGGSLLASRRGTAAFRSMFLPKLDAEPEEPKIPGIVRFRKAAGVVRLLCMVCIVCRKILSQTIIEGSWLAMVESILQEAEESAKKAESQSKGSGQLSFDPHKFRRSGKNEDIVPFRVKELLKKSSKDRTEEEADTIVRTMQKMPDFALFPFEIQKQLCQVAWYDSFGTGRVIIREGHAADGFYFVLSGRLVESYAAEDEANTVLRHGMKFGERELLTRTKRKSTVLTQERTELFCVHVQDYVRIFNLQDDMDTANLNVCRHLSIFKLWPIDKLLEHPDAWTMQNYQPGFVIVPDSRRCDWIYVVKTGQCKVLKRLTPNEGWTVDPREENRLLHSREMGRAHRERKELITAQGDREKGLFTCLFACLFVVDPREENRLLHSREMGRAHRERKELITAQGDREKGLFTCLFACLFVVDQREENRLLHSREMGRAHRERKELITAQGDREKGLFTCLFACLFVVDPREENRLLHSREMGRAHRERKELITAQGDREKGLFTCLFACLFVVDPREENRLLHSREMGRAHRERKELITAQGDREKDNRALISVLWRNVSTPRTPISGIHTARLDSRHDNREKGPSRMQLGSRIFDPDPSKPVFVVLDVLGPGQAFGFRSVLSSSERGPSVSLVSNSAEVIQIKKKFFLRYADETILSLLKMKYTPYPSQEDVLESLWKEHQWEDFKRDALYRAVSSVTSRQAVQLQRPKTTKTN
ncbi:uncharacterized protein [Branchiostoma lanceolatum]|uniref:uncharacterized protein n=1 Tax=Branchiostoma lanceolatum TaxID=7740 RepID=UPI0034512212